MSSKLKLTSTQKNTLQQFRNITSTSEKVATDFLKKSNWELDRAVDDYYNSTNGGLSSVTLSKEMEEAFEKYKQASNNTNEDTINNVTLDGILELAKDLETDPESDPLIFVLFYKLGCKSAYNITPDEWKQGMGGDLKVTKMDQLKKKISQVKSDIYNDNQLFKDFYEYVFDYSLDEGAKTVPPDIAIGQWKLIMKGKYKFLDAWCEYIEKVFKKAITADTWKLFLDFTKNYATGDYKDYDADAGAWPVAIDDFCVWHQEKLKK